MDTDELLAGYRGEEDSEKQQQQQDKKALEEVFKLMLENGLPSKKMDELRKKAEWYFTPLLLVVCYQWLLEKDKKKVEERWKGREKNEYFRNEIESCSTLAVDNAKEEYDRRFAQHVGCMMRNGCNPIDVVNDMEEERTSILSLLGMEHKEKKTIDEFGLSDTWCEEYPSYVERNLKGALAKLMQIMKPSVSTEDEMVVVDKLLTANRIAQVVINTLEKEKETIETLKRKMETQKYRIYDLKRKRDFYKKKAAGLVLPDEVVTETEDEDDDEEKEEKDEDDEDTEDDEEEAIAATSDASSTRSKKAKMEDC
jgi:hypothetical protein